MNEITIKEERQKKCNSQTHKLIKLTDRLTQLVDNSSDKLKEIGMIAVQKADKTK